MTNNNTQRRVCLLFFSLARKSYASRGGEHQPRCLACRPERGCWGRLPRRGRVLLRRERHSGAAAEQKSARKVTFGKGGKEKGFSCRAPHYRYQSARQPAAGASLVLPAMRWESLEKQGGVSSLIYSGIFFLRQLKT